MLLSMGLSECGPVRLPIASSPGFGRNPEHGLALVGVWGRFLGAEPSEADGEGVSRGATIPEGGESQEGSDSLEAIDSSPPMHGGVEEVGCRTLNRSLLGPAGAEHGVGSGLDGIDEGRVVALG